MDEGRFWSMIADAWADTGDFDRERRVFLAEPCEDRLPSWEAIGAMCDALRVRLDQLGADELVAFDRILERKLYAIDREEIHDHTDGGDDGFLYARGFIVGMGREYYDAVHADPSQAVLDSECEVLCYLPVHLYEDKFGEFPHSDISRETGSNDAGWIA